MSPDNNDHYKLTNAIIDNKSNSNNNKSASIKNNQTNHNINKNILKPNYLISNQSNPYQNNINNNNNNIKSFDDIINAHNNPNHIDNNNNNNSSVKGSKFINPLKNRLQDLLKSVEDETDAFIEIRMKYKTKELERNQLRNSLDKTI